MARIRERWGRTIGEASHVASFPPEFLAALIANESGGSPEARRFEPQVYERLTNLPAQAGIRDPEKRRVAASSLGLTQIMGYHAVRRGVDPARLFDPEFNLRFAVQMLADFAGRWDLDSRLRGNDTQAVTPAPAVVPAKAGTHRGFTPAGVYAALFRCWNTGSPKGKTHDPNYIAKGLARMKIYAELALESEPTRPKGVGG